MFAFKPRFVAGVAVLTALVAALAFESVYDITIRPRAPDPLIAATRPVEPRGTPTQPAFPLRLVDIGGVGIPLNDAWGTDYSHDRRAFRDVILQEPPYIDADALRRVEQDWHAYVERMLAYGNNAVVVPLLLELIDFDRRPAVAPGSALTSAAPARAADSVPIPIYGADSPFRARHAAVRRAFMPLFEWTARRGMRVFLDTDMLTVTLPLLERLRQVAPDASAIGVDAANPAVWAVYRAGLEELFDDIPSVSGLVIRFGEGGNLYNTSGWPYRSEVAIRNAESLQAMLRGLLPAFEARDKTLVLRSWTVGVGRIGRLHVDPRVYERVLGGIESPSLVVSTKYVAGDFFSYLPLNPTLAGGRHRRLVELQAKPEFEGFSAFPDFLGDDHARALRAFRSANLHLIGTYLYTQAGGPLRAGPRTVYPLHGFWLWTDANVFVASRLAIDPDADVSALVRRWAAERFGEDPRIVDAVAEMLTSTRKAVLDGFYIRPFAEREVRVPGLELPPLMWIFEWDMVGGWHSLLSLMYRGSRDAVDRAIDEGHAATDAIRRSRLQLQAAFAAAGPGRCTRLCDDALRSLEYQESLFEALAGWRQAFLSYYRWLDTGGDDAWRQWQAGRTRFEGAADSHVARFGRDLSFPAFDLTSAQRAVDAADRAVWARRIGVGVVIAVVSLLALGSPIGRRWRMLVRVPALAAFSRLAWTATATPWRLRGEPVDVGASAAVTTFALGLVGLLVATLTGFTTASLVAGSPLLCGVVALAFESTARGGAGRDGRGRLLVASVGPLMPGLILLFAAVAYFGPLGFWYRFWIWPVFRIGFLIVLLAMLLWTAYIMLAAHTQDGWSGRLGGALVALGAGLIVLTAALPTWIDALRFLDRPLNFAPATDTMLFALRTYAGVNLDVGLWTWGLGALLLVGGYAIVRRR